ncbi:MAG: FHA domain-containing protein [Lachnospiraceae bacterium]|nr:FHA domain-containing protein [Lachnospiraceae bacterium]
MQITYKRNGLKNYMVVKHERNDAAMLREKMMIRNEIPHLTKMIPQSIDGYSYYYYDIQGRVSLAALFQSGGIKKGELDTILGGLGELLFELQRYMLLPDEVIFDPQAIWISPDTLDPSFIYVPGMTKYDEYDIRVLAEFLAGHTDGNDREAAAKAYGYLERVENGYILPDMQYDRIRYDRENDNEDFAARSSEAPIDPDEYWDIKEGISEDMKPFFETDSEKDRTKKRKRAAYISLGIVMAAAVLYIAVLMDPALLPVTLSEQEYLMVGAAIAASFSLVLIGVMLMCKGRQSDRQSDNDTEGKCKDKESVSGRSVADTKYDNEDNHIEEDIAEKPLSRQENGWMSFLDKRNSEYGIRENEEEDDEKTVLIRRPGSFGGRTELPSLSYQDGRKVIIRKFPFVMGKMRTRVDGVIDGEGVSRIHAMIKELDGRYYVSDLNSLNGTAVNGNLLNINETREITDGDSIELADTVLIFRTGKINGSSYKEPSGF